MSTTVLDAYSKAFPAIVNRIRASVFKESDLMAPVATIIDTTAGHPVRIYHFPGLPRDNYAFSLDEIDGGGAVINNLAKFDVVPGQTEGLLTRGDEQIKVGVTPGFDVGLNTVTFDGTETAPGSGLFKPNYIGYQITPSELTNRGILERGLDYSWDSVTGVMTWLQAGDILALNTTYNIHFDPISNPPESLPTIFDFSTRIVTEDDSVEITDFGGCIIIEPEGPYLELLLPQLITIPQGRILRIESSPQIGSTIQCTRVIPFDGDDIAFLRGNLLLHNNESFEIYRFNRAEGVDEWRIRSPYGNFKNVGELVSDDQIQSLGFCKQLLDGSIKDKLQYARIYEEVVTQLPPAQVVHYDDWATGNNKYYYSYADSADIGNSGKFHFPDRRNLFERNNNTGKSGDYAADKVGPHTHGVKPPGANSQVGSGNTTTGNTPLGADGPINEYNTETNNLAGTETYPKNYLINKYVLI